MKLSRIAELVQGDVEGGNQPNGGVAGSLEIERLAKIEDAGSGDITFLSNPKYAKYLATTKASAVLVARGGEHKELDRRSVPLTLVKVDDPYGAFAKLIDVFYPSPAVLAVGVHPTAVVPKSVSLGNNVAIGAHVVMGERCKVGDGVALWHGVVLGDDAEIGESSTVYANVSIREQCKVGKRVIIHSGTVVGSDGFGFAPKPDGTYEKIPQRGIVVIEDDVEIGANCAVDRATIGETRIKRGAKLDNLIQVAHNVVIGENTVIAAQTGVSGSTRIGKGCVIGGQVGFAGHIEIADNTSIGAQSGLHKSISEPGKAFFGSPVVESREAFRITAGMQQIPGLLETVRELRKQVAELYDALDKRNKKS